MGRQVSPAWVGSALAGGAPAPTPEPGFAGPLQGRTGLELSEGLKLRRVRVMGAHRIELSGFSDTMRDRLRAFGLFGELTARKLRMFVPTDASGVGVLAKCSNVTRSNGSVNGKPRDAARRFRTGTPPRARGRGGVPPLSLKWEARGAVLVGWRSSQHAGPLAVRAAPGLAEGTCRQVDRRRDLRPWRFARHH